MKRVVSDALLQASMIGPGNELYDSRPNVNGAIKCIGGKISQFDGPRVTVTSPILDSSTGQRTVIGSMAQFAEADALEAIEAAKGAWDAGQGVWPQMSPSQRIAALEAVVVSLREKRQEIIRMLEWEICKSVSDAEVEFDRTMLFISATIQAFKDSDAQSSGWVSVSGILAKVRRSPIGVVLCLGPFNYPFNETYTALVPALLTGNVVVLKIPTLGGLAHVLTMDAWAKHLPMGAINFVSGSGRVTMSPMMKTGAVDVLAFIGGSASADAIIKDHPSPHRLKLFLQLEGKNLGIVLPDADLDVAAEQITLGSTTYNGQRCTAIKLVMVHESVAEAFLPKLVAKIAALKVGLPWDKGVQITPLPEPAKPQFLTDLIADAVSKGAAVVNSEQGGGLQEAALMTPAIVYPVTANMRLYNEEQFGPVVPVATFSDIKQVAEYYKSTSFGQQAAVFTTQTASAAPLIDILATAVGRININAQCARSPDVLPFSGRKSSALGTMSVSEGIKIFTTETVLATKETTDNSELVKGFDQSTNLMSKY